MSTTVNPTLLWAQRSNATEAEKNVLYVTIQVTDPVDVKVDLTSTTLEFSAYTSDKKTHYQLKLDLFAEIDVEHSKKNTDSGSHVYLVLRKKVAQEEYWPRLTKEKVRLHYLKTDFDKWVDEDEQDEQPEEDETAGMQGMGGMPGMGGMGGMPGMPGMGGMGGMPGMEGLGGMGGAGGDMDFAKLMQQMGGMGGAGGPGGDFDISKLASQLGQAGANLDGINAEDDEDDEAEAEVEEVK
ncbi:co-chaperone protein Sba1p [[Candida] anglica]|uniref:Co-chaperone protein Sba1p n=1 Tax=[Candida] anglica TaxID=148631 RepID=A0ABP0EHJ8_9ASCO